MRFDHLTLLRCPETAARLTVRDTVLSDGRIESGTLVAEGTGREYPIRGFIPRFEHGENYAANFGLEWHRHAHTQYDRESGFSVSRERFLNETRWSTQLEGELVLEPGSGSGRFTEQLLTAGATVASFDYSQAVEVNYRANGPHPNLLLVQADICRMPFARGTFDKVMCLGVLQHTPDPKRAFFALYEMLKPGGQIVSDVYLKSFTRYYLNTRYWVRPLTRRMEPQRLYRLTRAYVDLMWPLAHLIRRLPYVGEAINWRLLIADYSQLLAGADEQKLKEWAYLDTFDMLSPRYDQPQTLRMFRTWHVEAGCIEIDVQYGYNGLEARARKPSTGCGGQVDPVSTPLSARQ